MARGNHKKSLKISYSSSGNEHTVVEKQRQTELQVKREKL